MRRPPGTADADRVQSRLSPASHRRASPSTDASASGAPSRSWRRSSATLDALNALRHFIASRPTWSVWATSANDSRGLAARYSARFVIATWSRSRSRAESTMRQGRACDSGAMVSWNSSTTRCAFVPLRPNELTAARRGTPPGVTHARRSVCTKNRAAREIDALVLALEVQRGHQLPVAHAQQHLDQTGEPGSRHRMPDVRLRRSDRAILRPIRETPERVGQRLDFDRVSELRAGAVRFDVGERGGIDSEPAVDVDLERGLGRCARRRDAVRAPVVVDARSLDHPVDLVPVAQRGGHRFRTIAATPSAGTKPAARLSNARHVPSGDSMPVSASAR